MIPRGHYGFIMKFVMLSTTGEEREEGKEVSFKCFLFLLLLRVLF